jgi:pyridoxal phosphate enzyme (YggS family)
MQIGSLILTINIKIIMAINITNYHSILQQIGTATTLVAVSKTKPIEDITALYNVGQRHFGENYVQELVDKQASLPTDIYWHFIGHLQSNKVKFIAPFVHLIHGVDSSSLLQEINKQAAKNNRIIHCLLQIHIAKEDTKFGFNEADLSLLKIDSFKNINIVGVMGMATFTNDVTQIRQEFKYLKSIFCELNNYLQVIPNAKNFNPQILSMGMSSDYTIAMEEGSNMVRIGSLLFGQRNTHT